MLMLDKLKKRANAITFAMWIFIWLSNREKLVIVSLYCLLVFLGVVVEVSVVFCDDKDMLSVDGLEFDEAGKVKTIAGMDRETFLGPYRSPAVVERGIVGPLDQYDQLQICLSNPNMFIKFPENHVLGACVLDWDRFFDDVIEPFLVNHKEGFRILYDSPEYQVYLRPDIKANYINVMSGKSNHVEDFDCVALKMVPSRPKPRFRF